MNILFVGDIVGRPGRDLVRRALPVAIDRFGVDFVIANVENAASGAGITRECGDALLSMGIDVMTSGNHVWDKREALTYVGAEPRILRPLNMAPGVPGRGSMVARAGNGTPVGVINAIGRVFMAPVDNPFSAVLEAAERLRQDCRIVIVDFHAEATAEKVALGYYVDGRVSAVLGTHTHVPTADNRILAGGTAYLTDVGMTGPHDSIIGVEREAALTRFVSGLPARFEPATGGLRFQAAIVTVDEGTGKSTAIERIDWTPDAITAAESELDREDEKD